MNCRIQLALKYVNLSVQFCKAGLALYPSPIITILELPLIIFNCVDNRDADCKIQLIAQNLCHLPGITV